MSRTGLIVDEFQEFSSEVSNRKVSTRKTDLFTLKQLVQNDTIKYLQELSKCFLNRYLKMGKDKTGIYIFECKAAKELRMNYSSAKSLIHYYKTEKRPIPDQVKSLIVKKNKPHFVQQRKNERHLSLFVEIKVNHEIINSYNYFQKLHNDVKEETI